MKTMRASSVDYPSGSDPESLNLLSEDTMSK